MNLSVALNLSVSVLVWALLNLASSYIIQQPIAKVMSFAATLLAIAIFGAVLGIFTSTNDGASTKKYVRNAVVWIVRAVYCATVLFVLSDLANTWQVWPPIACGLGILAGQIIWHSYTASPHKTQRPKTIMLYPKNVGCPDDIDI